MAAIDHWQLDHVVARFEGGNVGTDLFDDSGSFMAENAGIRRGKITFVIVEVAMADAGGLDFDQHLWPLGPVDFDFFNTQFVRTLEDRCSHGIEPRLWLRAGRPAARKTAAAIASVGCDIGSN